MLTEKEDPIRAGADGLETALAVPTLADQYFSEYDPVNNAYGGHFYFGDHAPFEEGQRRRRALASELVELGLR